MTVGARRPRVLVLTRAYPNNVLPTFGIWTQRLVQTSTGVADPTVVAPVPYAPPGVPLEVYSRYRRVLQRRNDDGITVHHPRVPAGPGQLVYSFDAALSYPFVRRLTDQLHEENRFDLIHAHFIYPDGVLAARLGQRYGIPVMTTEQAWWTPGMDPYPRVKRQVLDALPHIRLVTAVSEAVRHTITAVAGDRVRTAILRNVVDERTFHAPTSEESWDENQILFVAVVRKVKGLDVLVRAMERLRPRRPAVRLVALGAPFYPSYQRDEMEVRRLVGELGLQDRIHFAGQADPTEVAAAMRRSALLVLPSRREAFPAVVIEALASGTPVVATRCGGPEEIVTPEVGRLVPPEDPEALANAIDEMLTLRPGFDRLRLREYVLARCGQVAVAARVAELYGEVLEGGVPDAAAAA